MSWQLSCKVSVLWQPCFEGALNFTWWLHVWKSCRNGSWAVLLSQGSWSPSIFKLYLLQHLRYWLNSALITKYLKHSLLFLNSYLWKSKQRSFLLKQDNGNQSSTKQPCKHLTIYLLESKQVLILYHSDCYVICILAYALPPELYGEQQTNAVVKDV